MNVLLINGSPHAKGCTYTALSEIEKTLQEQGIDTEIIHVGHKDIHGCIACNKCAELGHCVFNDLVNETAPKFERADGIVIGSPVYYAGISGTLKSFLDRLFYSAHCDKRMKIGAAVTSARRAGTVATFDIINKYSLSQAGEEGQRAVDDVKAEVKDAFSMAKKDKEGMQCMRQLGRNMAFLLRAISAEKQRNGLPEQEERVWTNFI